MGAAAAPAAVGDGAEVPTFGDPAALTEHGLLELLLGKGNVPHPPPPNSSRVSEGPVEPLVLVGSNPPVPWAGRGTQRGGSALNWCGRGCVQACCATMGASQHILIRGAGSAFIWASAGACTHTPTLTHARTPSIPSRPPPQVEQGVKTKTQMVAERSVLVALVAAVLGALRGPSPDAAMAASFGAYGMEGRQPPRTCPPASHAHTACRCYFPAAYSLPWATTGMR